MEQPGLLSRSRGFNQAPRQSPPACLSLRLAHPSPSLPPPPWPTRVSKTRLLFRRRSSKVSDLLACTQPACLTRPRHRLCSQ